MSWLSSWVDSFSKWWKRNNSIGDVIYNNEPFILASVQGIVAWAWSSKESAERKATICAQKLLDGVLKPLPDYMEQMVDAAMEPKVASFFHSALTLKDTKAEAVEHIMVMLKGLK